MKIDVISKSKNRKIVIEHLVKFYAKRLKLLKSQYTLSVISTPKFLKQHGFNGAVYLIDDRELVMMLDSRLTVADLIKTSAHEMIHVKQYARGQLKSRSTRAGKINYIWMGTRCNKQYYDRPWEIEAFSRERLLYNQVLRRCFPALDK